MREASRSVDTLGLGADVLQMVMAGNARRAFKLDA